MTDTSWLHAARERCEAATEGPWKFWDISIDTSIGCKVTRLPGAILPTVKDDAKFIAHARTDLPLALDLLAQAAEVLAAVEWGASNEYGTYCPSCHNYYMEEDHAGDCQLAAILSRIRAGGEG